jgi:hypothetical protein
VRLELGHGVVVHRERTDRFISERAWWLKLNQELGGGWEVQDFHAGCYLTHGKTRLVRTDLGSLMHEWAAGKVVLEKT